MIQPNLLQVATQMVVKVLSSGQQPIAFVMSQTTAESISEQFLADHKRRLSLAGRFWFWLMKRNIPPRLNTLCGLPVYINPQIPDGGMYLQSTDAAPHAGQPQAGPPEEFMKREKVEPQPMPDGEVKPTLDDLASSGGDRPSSSDVIMRAMDRVDELSGVAVVRVYKNGDIDLCANIGKYALQGVLQHAQMWVLQNGQN